MAADPAMILYGTNTGLAHVFARLDPSEQQVLSRGTDGTKFPQLFGGTKTPMIRIISESGLYKLIMRSDKADASV